MGQFYGEFEGEAEKNKPPLQIGRLPASCELQSFIVTADDLMESMWGSVKDACSAFEMIYFMTALKTGGEKRLLTGRRDERGGLRRCTS